MERLAIRGLHRDPILTSDAGVEIDAGSGESVRAPPLRQVIRLGQRFEHALARNG
jgi:hypothetical protein